jgi:leucyl/phenylalanyl-tRNA--protein transferase
MADGRDDPRLLVIEPERRGILPLTGFHTPARLKRQIRQNRFQITANQAFREVIEECAAQTGSRTETWINRQIIQLYDALHRDGFAHSIEVWDNNTLVGGLYGVAIGGAFFGESMFTRKDNASKIALVHLVAALLYADFKLLDAQFLNDHLKQFGIIEISKEDFQIKLKQALKVNSVFPSKLFAPQGHPRAFLEKCEAVFEQETRQPKESRAPFRSGQNVICSSSDYPLSQGQFCLETLAKAQLA